MKRILAVLFAALLVFSGCGGDDDDTGYTENNSDIAEYEEETHEVPTSPVPSESVETFGGYWAEDIYVDGYVIYTIEGQRFVCWDDENATCLPLEGSVNAELD